MAVTVTHDFTEIFDADVTTNWTNAQTQDDDLKIEGLYCNTTTVSNTTKALYELKTAASTIPSGNHVFIWGNSITAGIHDTKANAGTVVYLGQSTSNWKKFKVDGKDTNTVGGWKCYVVNPEGTADSSSGTYTPSSDHRLTGFEIKTVAAVKSTFRNFGADIARHGTGFTVKGDGSTIATFDDLLAKENELSGSTRIGSYGVVTAISGVYYLAGKIKTENAAAATSIFKETSKTVVFQEFPVSNTFHEFSATGTASYSATVQFGNYSGGATSAGCTIQGAGAAVWNLTGSTYGHIKVYASNLEGMRAATFSASSEMRDCVLTNCGTIEANGGVISNCSFNSPSATAIKVDSASEMSSISGVTFNSSGTGHALEITATGSYTFTDVSFSGYAATNGSTGNEAVYFNVASGSITVYADSTFSYRLATSSTATVNIIAGSVTATLTVTNTAGAVVSGAQVMVQAKDATGPMPYDVTVTIANSGTTATVTHTSHGLLTNDKVKIKGASHYQNNGVFSITKINDNSYSYTMSSAPGSNPTGTIKATWVALYGSTDANGQVSMSRVFSADQPVSGWARKSTNAPYYKTAQVSGSIDSATGASLSALLIPDE